MTRQIISRLEEFKVFYPFVNEIEETPAGSATSPHVFINFDRRVAYRVLGEGKDPSMVEVEVVSLRAYLYRQYDLTLIG